MISTIERAPVRERQRGTRFRCMSARISEAGVRLRLLAPELHTPWTRLFPNARREPATWARMRDSYFRFRTGQYVDRGLLSESTQVPLECHDRASWILTCVDESDAILGALCLRAFHPDLSAARSLFDWKLIQAIPEYARHPYEQALLCVVHKAIRQGLVLGEVSHWAVAPRARRTSVGSFLPVVANELYSLLGPAVVLSTANVDSGAFGMLQRMGWKALTANGEVLQPFPHPFYRARLGLFEMYPADLGERFRPADALERDLFMSSLDVVVAQGAPAASLDEDDRKIK